LLVSEGEALLSWSLRARISSSVAVILVPSWSRAVSQASSSDEELGGGVGSLRRRPPDLDLFFLFEYFLEGEGSPGMKDPRDTLLGNTKEGFEVTDRVGARAKNGAEV